MKCSQGDRYIPREKKGWELLSMTIAKFRFELESCGCQGEEPFKLPGGFLLLSYVDAVLFCGISLNDLGVITLSG